MKVRSTNRDRRDRDSTRVGSGFISRKRIDTPSRAFSMNAPKWYSARAFSEILNSQISRAFLMRSANGGNLSRFLRNKSPRFPAVNFSDEEAKTDILRSREAKVTYR